VTNSCTYSITYTGQSERTDLAGDVTVTGSAPSGTSISPMSLSVPGHGTFTIKQTGIPGDATAAGLRVHVQWPDGVARRMRRCRHADVRRQRVREQRSRGRQLHDRG